MNISILATADLHLGRRSSGISVSSEIGATRYTWSRIVERAIAEDVSVVTLAGDIIEYENRLFESIGPLKAGFNKLNEAGIPVVMVSGNHDYGVLAAAVNKEEYPDVHLLGEGGEWETLTIETGDGAVQFIGWSFLAQHVPDDPLLEFPQDEIDPNLPVVGVVHGDLDAAESSYAPLALSRLVRSGADAWILGHIHKPAICKEEDPLILYPGSPQALSPKEQGGHGPFLLNIHGKEDISPQQLFLSAVRYEKIDINVEGVTDQNQLVSRIVAGITRDVKEKERELLQVDELIYDITLVGRHAQIKDLKGWSNSADDFRQKMNPEVWVSIRSIQSSLEPKVDNLEELAKGSTPPAILARTILDLQQDRSTGMTDDLIAEFSEQLNRANSSATYFPIDREEQLAASEETAKEFLLQECHTMLAELLSQNKN